MQLTYIAQAEERVRIESRMADGGLMDGSARVMVAVEPAGRAESSLEGDGTAYLNSRQHLLLNLFGIMPSRLHPHTGLALAEALDALEILGRRASQDPASIPAGAGAYTLKMVHGQEGSIERATFELVHGETTLRLTTVFDGRSGALRCRLHFQHPSGAIIDGALTHTVALSDGIPVMPAADPVGDYLTSDPTAYGPLDDFADVPADNSEEGIGSFLEGAVAGDFADNDSWSALGGQVAVGFVPVAGQIADARDIIAAGADVAGGREGAWMRLGIAVVAVIPGLDFLKGGSKAGRKTLREASEGAVEGQTKASVKRATKVVSKEAVALAKKELKALAVARQEMLVRMESLLFDENLRDATKNAIRKARNAVQDHLQPKDLAGAWRDKLGLPVRASGSGAAWDHLGEVTEVLRALKRLNGDNLLRDLRRLDPRSEAYGKLSREINAISEMQQRIQQFLEIQ